MAVALVLLAAGCAEQVSSTPTAITTSTTTSTSTTTTVAPTTSTSTTTTTAPTSTSTTTTTTTTSTSTTTTTTTVPAPVGDFACNPAGELPAIWEVRPPSDLPHPELGEEWATSVIGSSVQGRDIEVYVRPAELLRRRVLVIGGIHGNEPVTPPVVRGLLDVVLDDDVELWLVPVANPDGSAAGTRCNAHGVDLNRNFSWTWRGRDGGPAPLSEPETRALATLVEQLQPDVVVWVHQPLGYVSSIGTTSSALEQAWAEASGLPVRPDVTQHGGGETWTNFVAGVPSMLIEIDGWTATTEIVAAQRAGFEAMVTALD